MNYEWRLKYIWPSVLSWVGALNFGTGIVKENIVCIILGILLTGFTIWIVRDNIKEDTK